MKKPTEERIARLRALGLDLSGPELALLRAGYPEGKLDYLEHIAKTRDPKVIETVEFFQTMCTHHRLIDEPCPECASDRNFRS